MDKQIIELVNANPRGITVREVGYALGVFPERIADFDYIGIISEVQNLVANGDISALGSLSDNPGCYSAILMPRLVGLSPISKTKISDVVHC